LSGANLCRASLKAADLRGTNFRAASPGGLYPGPGLYPSRARPGVVPLPDAVLREDTDVEDATYDDSTEWPEGYDPTKGGAVHVKDRSPWWRIRHIAKWS